MVATQASWSLARERGIRTMRMRMRMTLFVMCVWILPASLDACELTAWSPWFSTEAELVAGTTEIFIGRVLGERPETSDRRESATVNDDVRSRYQWSFHLEYEMEVVERIKGMPPDRVWVGPFAPVDRAAEANSRGRVAYGADCKMLARFERGQRYLVFRGSFHPKGYERLVVDDDPWLETVRTLVRTAAARGGDAGRRPGNEFFHDAANVLPRQGLLGEEWRMRGSIFAAISSDRRLRSLRDASSARPSATSSKSRKSPVH